jgi:uncharacterized protein (DUF488 family)
VKLFTIGFTKRSAEGFFTALKQSGATRLIDVRLNNSSQLAGFTKKEDLRYFLNAICGMEYVHLAELAPTQALLDSYKKEKMAWDGYETLFLGLLRERAVEKKLPRELLDNACLLCSEPEPNRCHRRLVAEYLQQEWGNIEIHHL